MMLLWWWRKFNFDYWCFWFCTRAEFVAIHSQIANGLIRSNCYLAPATSVHLALLFSQWLTTAGVRVSKIYGRQLFENAQKKLCVLSLCEVTRFDETWTA